ncbi:MAG: SDR family oxidoreductase [Steroidobacteraceae bacterium]|jgi:NAD(P)-dependent dehydrogenase (short-subunit alcohol dehydrogenase family)|nr:SDR family oxidoreductase [Steroidobacteraceae bacterium]
MLDGRIVLVAGASSGMGRATAEALARHGAHVLLAARRAALCEEVAAGIRSSGGEATALPADVSDEAAVAALFATIEARFGRLDGAFNNVGRTLGSSPLQDTPTARLRQTLEINLVAVFHCLRHELRLMRAAGGGAIVNNSSIGGTRGFANLSDYCAAKWGLIGMTKAAALENAPHGVRVNVIAPGLVATERFEQVRAEHPAVIAARLAEVPMQRPGAMQDVGETVAWLLGPGANYLTGAVVPIDGGECAR